MNIINPDHMQFRFNFNPATLNTEVFIVKHSMDGRKTYIAKPFKLEFEEVNLGAIIGPSFCIPDFKQFAKDVYYQAENAGICPDYQSVAEGKLEATKEHLEDMRRLVFNDSKTDN